MFGYSSIIDLIIVVLAVVVSVMVHEVAHGYVALLNGDPTAKLAGRLSFNPVKHFDPIGFLMLIFVRFGYAKPVPVNPYNYKNRKVGAITVALAGIVANLLMAFFFSMLFRIFAVYSVNKFMDVCASMCLWFVVININLALFNLLPLYPLDGYRFLDGVMKITNPILRFLRNYSLMILYLLVIISFLSSILIRVSPIFQYFDVLGLYISYFRDLIMKGFNAFWALFIH